MPLNYHGWTIFGLGLVGGDLLSFNLMAHGVAAEGRPHRAKLIFSRPTRAIFSRSNYLHQGRLSRIEEISHREIDGPRTAYHFYFTGGSFIEIEARGCAAIEW